MLGVLGFILSGIELIGSYVLWAVETFANLLFAALGACYAALVALLPGMSSAPAIGSPTWLGWLSWFFPVGPLVAGLTALLTMWVAYLAVRWVLKLVRGI